MKNEAETPKTQQQSNPEQSGKPRRPRRPHKPKSERGEQPQTQPKQQEKPAPQEKKPQQERPLQQDRRTQDRRERPNKPPFKLSDELQKIYDERTKQSDIPQARVKINFDDMTEDDSKLLGDIIKKAITAK